jgi:methionyl-tRNA formyltransferase
MRRLRLAFMGTPAFAVPVLAALRDAGHDIAAVYTQPPRPAGRGHAVKPSPVQEYAAKQGLPVRVPATLKSREAQEEFRFLALDAAVVAAYGLILPRPILDAPGFGCLNVHASLLPRWRGAAPIQRAILAGDTETGITIMQMDEGLDTGDMILAEATPIGPEDTGGTLHDRLAEMGARLIVQALDLVAERRARPQRQPAAGVTYAKKIERAETRIDWRGRAGDEALRVRAFAPAPGAFFERDGERVRVLAAAAVPGGGAAPGTVLDDHLTVACGEGALRLTRLQRAGRSPMAAADFLRGVAFPAGTRLATDPP